MPNVKPAEWSELKRVFRDWRTPSQWPARRKILSVRWMTKRELESEGWLGMGGGIAIDLDDGSILFAAADAEGNGPGALFGISPRGEAVTVMPEQK